MEKDKDWNLIPLIATFVLKPNNGTQGSVAIAKRTQKTLNCETVHLLLLKLGRIEIIIGFCKQIFYIMCVEITFMHNKKMHIELD